MSKLKNKLSHKTKSKAFTMAEAILVMTILGIIATIMITTIKPAEFKQKALKVLAKKVFSEVDSTMTQIIINNTKTGEMDKLFLSNDSSYFSFGEDLSKTEQLFKKYLATTRKEYSASDKLGTFKTIVANSPASASQSPPFYLKDGALVFLGTGEKYGVSLGATGTIDVEGCAMPKSLLGIITVDVNGEDEPNVAYQDQFHFPIGLNGVEYEYMCTKLDGNSGQIKEPAISMQHLDDYFEYQKQVVQMAKEEFEGLLGFELDPTETLVGNWALERSLHANTHCKGDDGSYDVSCEAGAVNRGSFIDKDGNYLYGIGIDADCCGGYDFYARVINGEIKKITASEFDELAEDGQNFTLEELNYIHSSSLYSSPY